MCYVVGDRSSDVVSASHGGVPTSLHPLFGRVCLSTKNYANVEAAGSRLLRTTKRFFLTRREKLLSNMYFILWEDYFAEDAELFLPICIYTSRFSSRIVKIVKFVGWNILFYFFTKCLIFRKNIMVLLVLLTEWTLVKKYNFEFEFYSSVCAFFRLLSRISFFKKFKSKYNFF